VDEKPLRDPLRAMKGVKKTINVKKTIDMQPKKAVVKKVVVEKAAPKKVAANEDEDEDEDEGEDLIGDILNKKDDDEDDEDDEDADELLKGLTNDDEPETPLRASRSSHPHKREEKKSSSPKMLSAPSVFESKPVEKAQPHTRAAATTEKTVDLDDEDEEDDKDEEDDEPLHAIKGVKKTIDTDTESKDSLAEPVATHMLSAPRVFTNPQATQKAVKQAKAKVTKTAKNAVHPLASVKAASPSAKKVAMKVAKHAKKVAAKRVAPVADEDFIEEDDISDREDDNSDYSFGLGSPPPPAPVSKATSGLLDGLMSESPSIDVFSHQGPNPTTNLMDNLMGSGF